MPRQSARILNSAWGFRSFLPHGGVMMTPSHSSVLGHPGEAGTTTNGGALRLLAHLELSEDRCIGRLLAVKYLRDANRPLQQQVPLRRDRRKEG
jgi:hypothetical protein